MKQLTKLGLLISFIGLISCSTSIKIYYNDTNEICGGEIRGGRLHGFFNKNEHIEVTTSSSRKFYRELERVRKEIDHKGETIFIDGMYYDFAFIVNNKDTMYLNASTIWRYKNKTYQFESKINKYVQPKPMPPLDPELQRQIDMMGDDED